MIQHPQNKQILIASKSQQQANLDRINNLIKLQTKVKKFVQIEKIHSVPQKVILKHFIPDQKIQNLASLIHYTHSSNKKIYNIMKVLWSDPLQLGKYTLKNRIMLAAMTRARCDPADGIPNDLLVKYYVQRSGAGLMLTQCASWSKRGTAFPGAGDIYTKQQAEGWKRVNTEVHKHGSKIYLQIFHAGRATHSQINGGFQPWAPSAQAILGDKLSVLGGASYPVPKQMTLEDIQFTKKQFEESIKLAKYAQFDGIQLHGANGYLIDQFIRSHSNKRTDDYGGNVAKRSRFVLELIDIALKYFQPYQVGIKFSPVGRNNYMFDQNPLQTYSYLLQRLSQRNIGFVEFMESSQTPGDKFVSGLKQIQNICKAMRPHFNGLLYGNMVPTPQAGLKKVQEGQCDGISFARLYIVNPDLEERLIHGYPLQTKYDYSTFYGLRLEDKSRGFTDYPTYKK